MPSSKVHNSLKFLNHKRSISKEPDPKHTFCPILLSSGLPRMNAGGLTEVPPHFDRLSVLSLSMETAPASPPLAVGASRGRTGEAPRPPHQDGTGTPELALEAEKQRHSYCVWGISEPYIIGLEEFILSHNRSNHQKPGHGSFLRKPTAGYTLLSHSLEPPFLWRGR